VWLSRVRELGGLPDASQCRVIAENGLDVTLICQHHVYTGCTSPSITNDVTIRILIRKSDIRVHRLLVFRVGFGRSLALFTSRSMANMLQQPPGFAPAAQAQSHDVQTHPWRGWRDRPRWKPHPAGPGYSSAPWNPTRPGYANAPWNSQHQLNPIRPTLVPSSTPGSTGAPVPIHSWLQPQSTTTPNIQRG
jgi:hypothetical protein